MDHWILVLYKNYNNYNNNNNNNNNNVNKLFIVDDIIIFII
jgi:hypothetical protein